MFPVELELIAFSYPKNKVVKGSFMVWKYGNIVYHMSKYFKSSRCKIVVTSFHIEKVLLKARLYLRGIRQHLWLRFKYFKGFISLLSLNIKTGELIFAVRAIFTRFSYLESGFQSFISSNQHKSLLRYRSSADSV